MRQIQAAITIQRRVRAHLQRKGILNQTDQQNSSHNYFTFASHKKSDEKWDGKEK